MADLLLKVQGKLFLGKGFMKKTYFFIAIMIFLFAMPSFAAAPARKPITPTGTLKIKVGVVMGSGEVQYLPKVTFYLTSKSFQDVQIGFLSEKPSLNLNNWLISQGASSELLSLLNKYREEWIQDVKDKKAYTNAKMDAITDGLDKSTIGYEIVVSNPEVPEFQNIIELLDQKYLKCSSSSGDFMCRMYKTEDEFKSHTLRQVVQESTFDYLKSESSFAKYNHKYWFEITTLARERIKKYVITSCTTNFDATCNIGPVKAGDYFITNVYPTAARRSMVVWDLKTKIKPGSNYLELSNDNMANTKNYATSDYEY